MKKNMITISNIKKSFGHNQVLKGIDLNVSKGEAVVIIGPSGSGKTTLLRCLNYLEKPDEGSITIGDFSIDCKHAGKKDIYQLRRKSAMVFQQYNLFKHKSALENVMEGLVVVKKLPKAEARERSVELLKKVGLANKLDAFPSQLSGGQQQRVGIARALDRRAGFGNDTESRAGSRHQSGGYGECVRGRRTDSGQLAEGKKT